MYFIIESWFRFDQGSNYIFRSDPQTFSDQFQHLGVWAKILAKILSKCKKIVYSFSLALFVVRYKQSQSTNRELQIANWNPEFALKDTLLYNNYALTPWVFNIKMGSMNINSILFHFNHSTLVHFLMCLLDGKSDRISKRCIKQAYCLIKVNTFMVQNISYPQRKIFRCFLELYLF